jgi:hypothetical protein
LAVESDSSPTALRHGAAALGMMPATVSNVHLNRNGRPVETLTAQAPPVVVAPVTTTPTASTKPVKSTKTGKPTTSTKSGTAAKAGTTGKTGTAAQTGTTGTSGTSGKHHHPHGTQAPQQ